MILDRYEEEESATFPPCVAGASLAYSGSSGLSSPPPSLPPFSSCVLPRFIGTSLSVTVNRENQLTSSQVPHRRSRLSPYLPLSLTDLD